MKFNDLNNYSVNIKKDSKYESIFVGDRDLTSLEGSPEKVDIFDCSSNDLITLKGCPKEVYFDFDCANNQLKSLQYIPKIIGNDFNCSVNKLTSLEGSPKKIGGDFICSHNKLKTLEGCSEEVGGNFDCSGNNIISLKGSPKLINGVFVCKNNQKIKNIKQQIIENLIKAKKYRTDEGDFSFEDIEKEFNIELIKKNKELLKLKNKLKTNDYGLSI